MARTTRRCPTLRLLAPALLLALAGCGGDSAADADSADAGPTVTGTANAPARPDQHAQGALTSRMDAARSQIDLTREAARMQAEDAARRAAAQQTSD